MKCLICSQEPCTCMTPEEALQRYSWLRNYPCVSCVHFWQVCSGNRRSRLYVDKRGRLMMIQACGLVPDYNIYVVGTNCDMFEEGAK
jgi:hypothetical protein